MTLGIFWNGQQAQLNAFTRSDRHLSWIHLAFLFAVSLMPFSTRLLAEYIAYRSVLIAYWGNILLLGLVLFVSWRYATRAGLLQEEITHDRQCAVERRIVVAQGLYAFGALLCLFNTYVSIAFIILVQVNFALAPRMPVFVRNLKPLRFDDVHAGRSVDGSFEQRFGNLIGRDHPVVAGQNRPQGMEHPNRARFPRAIGLARTQNAGRAHQR